MLLFFFFNDTATTEIYTLSLHDALPISTLLWLDKNQGCPSTAVGFGFEGAIFSNSKDKVTFQDRKSTRLNSSHQIISYAVFCLKKKKKKPNRHCTHHGCRHARDVARKLV